MIFVLLH